MTPRSRLALASLLGIGMASTACSGEEAVCAGAGEGSWTTNGYPFEAGLVATPLPDGRILVVGTGAITGEARTELYDAVADRAEDAGGGLFGGQTQTALLGEEEVLVVELGNEEERKARRFHAERGSWSDAALPRGTQGRLVGLADGGALLVGDVAERYDAREDGWSALGAAPRAFGIRHVVALADGRALVSGISSSNPGGTESQSDAAPTWHIAYLLDPATATWTRTHDELDTESIALLADGRLLCLRDREAIIWDPASDAIAEVAPAEDAHVYHGSARLEDGRVLFAGGDYLEDADSPDAQEGAAVSSELYDADRNDWTCAAPMPMARFGGQLVKVAGGLLSLGGVVGGAPSPATLFRR